MKLIGPAHVDHWLPELASLLGRDPVQLLSHGLQCTDFPYQGVALQADDGSVVLFRHAFAVHRAHEPRNVALFTEHNGYVEVVLHEEGELLDLTQEASRPSVRSPGKMHCVPLAPCPLCEGDVDILENSVEMNFTLECPDCGLTFGGPYGYSSRLDMARDWNLRPGSVRAQGGEAENAPRVGEANAESNDG